MLNDIKKLLLYLLACKGQPAQRESICVRYPLQDLPGMTVGDTKSEENINQSNYLVESGFICY